MTPGPGGGDSLGRMLRARERIGEHVGELEGRTRGALRQGRLAPGPGIGATSGQAVLRDRLTALDGVLERRIQEAARGVEDRVGEWVASRVKAAERRLELQAEALEATLGAGVSTAEMERVRVEVRAQVEADLERRLAEVADRLAAFARSSASAAALERLQGIEERLTARFEESVSRRDSQLAKAEAGPAKGAEQGVGLVPAATDSDLEAVVARARQGMEAAGAEVVERSRQELEEAASAAAEAASESRVAALEERLRASLGAAESEALRRIESAAAEATARIAAADAAQERELRIRERADRAREESEERVREAERRLAEVMGRLGGRH